MSDAAISPTSPLFSPDVESFPTAELLAALGKGRGSGYLSDLDAKQHEVLKSFLPDFIAARQAAFDANTSKTTGAERPSAKIKVKDYYEALRFLRARKFVAAESLKMYTAHLAWRANHHVDELLLSPALKPSKFELAFKLIPHSFHHFDKGGHPLFVEKLGRVDVQALMNLISGDEYLASHIYKTERMVREAERAEAARLAALKSSGSTAAHREKISEFTDPSGRIETFSMLLDLKGVTINTRRTQGYLGLCSKNDSDNYPERLEKLILVNVPFTFHLLWKLAQPLIDEKTKKKIVVIHGKPIHTLEKYIDKHLIPKEYGGECNCHNGISGYWGHEKDNSETAEAAGWTTGCVPEFDLKRLQLADLAGSDGAAIPSTAFIETAIGAGKKLELSKELKKGETAYWFYRVEKDDVRFSVTFVENVGKSGGEEQEIVEAARSPTAQGNFPCELDNGGTLIVRFDNHFSWLKEKKIRYALAIVKDDDNTVEKQQENGNGKKEAHA